MAAAAINGIRLSKSGAKAGLVATWGFNASWGVVRDMGRRGRRLVQSAAKPNMQGLVSNHRYRNFKEELLIIFIFL